MKRVYEQTVQMLRLASLCQGNWRYLPPGFLFLEGLYIFAGLNCLKETLLLITDLHAVVREMENGSRVPF